MWGVFVAVYFYGSFLGFYDCAFSVWGFDLVLCWCLVRFGCLLLFSALWWCGILRFCGLVCFGCWRLISCGFGLLVTVLRDFGFAFCVCVF